MRSVVTACSATKPGSTSCSATRLRTRRPALTRSTSDNATSVTTSIWRVRADRRANGHLFLADGAARQQQVRDVGAGDQQDGRDRAQEHDEPEPIVANETIPQEMHPCAARLVRFRIGECQPGGDRLELGLRLLDPGVRHQSADDVQEMRVALFPELGGEPYGAHGYPRLDRVRSEEHTSELQSLAYLVCRLLL